MLIHKQMKISLTHLKQEDCVATSSRRELFSKIQCCTSSIDFLRLSSTLFGWTKSSAGELSRPQLNKVDYGWTKLK